MESGHNSARSQQKGGFVRGKTITDGCCGDPSASGGCCGEPTRTTEALAMTSPRHDASASGCCGEPVGASETVHHASQATRTRGCCG